MQAQIIDRNEITDNTQTRFYAKQSETGAATKTRSNSTGLLLARMISVSLSVCMIMAVAVCGICSYASNLEVASKMTNYEINRVDESIEELRGEIDTIYNNLLINGKINEIDAEIADNSYFVTDIYEAGG